MKIKVKKATTSLERHINAKLFRQWQFF